MANDFDRDNLIEQTLTGARRSPASHEPGPFCIDAETLAAWADGGLSPEEIREVEAHVAGCARCQSLSAAFFGAAEMPASTPAPVVPIRRNRAVFWIPTAAAATIAASLLVWFGVLNRHAATPELTMSQAARQEMPAASAGASANQVASPTPVAPTPTANAAETRGAVEPAPRQEKALRDSAALQRSKPDRALDRLAKTAPAPVTAPPPPPPAAPPTTGLLSARTVAQSTPTPSPIPPPVTVTGASPIIDTRARADVAARDSLTFRANEPAVVAQFSARNLPNANDLALKGVAGVAAGAAGGRGGAGGGGGRGGGGGAGRGSGIGGGVAESVTVAKPDEPVHWRLLATDTVQRSTDLVTWVSVAITPPPQGLTSGDAPAPAICWIVGKAGLILRSIDGRQFERVAAPTSADLLSVKAIDGLQATVVTTTSQSFTTVDGGKTWR